MIVISLAEDDGATVGMPADFLLSREHPAGSRAYRAALRS